MTCAHGDSKTEEAGVWKMYQNIVDGAILVFGGERFKENKSLQSNLQSMTVHFTSQDIQAEEELFERRRH